MTTETINIVVREDGSREVKRRVEDIGSGARKAGGDLNFLKDALKGLIAVGVLRFLQELADTYTNINNRLRLVATSTSNLVAINNAVYESAQRTRTAYQATADLFSTVARNADVLGISQKEALEVTETIGQAIQVSGTNAANASAGILQLSQALGSGTLRGDELNSVLENMPRLAKAIMNEVGVQTGGQLRDLATKGAVTSQIVVEAIQKAGPAIAAEFSKITPTISGGFTVMRNGLMKFLGDLDQGVGVSASFAKALTAMGNNMDVVAIAATGLGVAVAVSFTGMSGAITNATRAVGAFTAVIASNPLGLIAVALTAAIVAIMTFGKEIKVTEDGAVSLRDAFLGGLAVIGDAFKFVGNMIQVLWMGLMGTLKVLGIDFGEATSSVFTALVSVAKLVGNLIIGGWVATYRVITATWSNLPGLMNAIWVMVANNAITAAESILNAWQLTFRSISALLGTVNKDAADAINGALDSVTVKLPRLQLNEAGRTYADAIKTGVSDAFSQDYLGNFAKAAIERARASKKEALGAPGLSTTSGDPVDLTSTKDAKDSKKITRDELLRRFQQDIDDQLKEGTFDYLERQVQTEINKLNAQLLDRQFAGLSEAERAQYAQVLRDLNRANELMEIKDRILQDAREPQRQYEMGLEAINEQVARYPQYADEFSRAARDMRIALLDTKFDASSGMERAILKMQAQAEDTASRVEQAFVNVFNNLEDAWVGFVTTGKISFTNLLAGLQEDLARSSFNDLIKRPLLNILSGGKGSSDPKDRGGSASTPLYVQVVNGVAGGLTNLIGGAPSPSAGADEPLRSVQETLSGFAGRAREIFGNASGALGNIFGSLGRTFGGLFQGLASTLGNIFSSIGGGGGGGWAQTIGTVASFFGSFATGGDFTVPGSGGVDSQLVTLRASPGERISVGRSGSEGGSEGGISIPVTIDARGAQEGVAEQIAEALAMAIPAAINQARRLAGQDVQNLSRQRTGTRR